MSDQFGKMPYQNDSLKGHMSLSKKSYFQHYNKSEEVTKLFDLARALNGWILQPRNLSYEELRVIWNSTVQWYKSLFSSTYTTFKAGTM